MRHPPRRSRGGGEGDRDARAAPGYEQQQRQDERPHDVELLLDRARPQIPEQVGRAVGEVTRPAGAGEPVVAEGRCTEALHPSRAWTSPPITHAMIAPTITATARARRR